MNRPRNMRGLFRQSIDDMVACSIWQRTTRKLNDNELRAEIPMHHLRIECGNHITIQDTEGVFTQPLRIA
jgi:hypothetical protein